MQFFLFKHKLTIPNIKKNISSIIMSNHNVKCQNITDDNLKVMLYSSTLSRVKET